MVVPYMFLKCQSKNAKGFCSEMNEKQRSNCVLIISHSNYLIKSGGVENFIREYGSILKNRDIHYIHVFPIIEVNKKFELITCGRSTKEYIGLSFDGKFQGIWKEKDLVSVVENILKMNTCVLNNSQIHHFHGWNIKLLTKALRLLNVPVYIFVHDLEMLCPNMFLAGAEEQCKVIVPVAGESICKRCIYHDVDFERFTEINQALKEILFLIHSIYVPSQNTMNHFVRAFPQFKNLIQVRSHLTYVLEHKDLTINKPIRVAYLGSVEAHKGYEEWKRLVDSISNIDYEFFYFGIRRIDDKRVKCVRVDSRNTQLKSMTEQLKEYNIDIAFLWSKCQETFCYTYYEAFEAGAYVITNDKSGNICDQVRKNQNGIVFNDISECIGLMKNVEMMERKLDDFARNNLIPCHVCSNEELVGIDGKQADTESIYLEEKQVNDKFNGVNKNVLLSLIYKKMRM